MSAWGVRAAMPAGSWTCTEVPLKRTDGKLRWGRRRVSRIWVRDRQREAPKESPARTIFEAQIGEWKESGGG